MLHPTDKIAHSTTFFYISHGALAGTKNSSMGPPWGIDPMTHRTMSGHAKLHIAPDTIRVGATYLNGSTTAWVDDFGVRSVRRRQTRPRLSRKSQGRERERERNVLFNDALNTFYLRLYGVRHMVKDHSESEKGNPLLPHRLLLSINSKGPFICTIPQTG